jgi:hypothetical protein
MAGYVASARLGAGTIRIDRPRDARAEDRSSPADRRSPEDRSSPVSPPIIGAGSAAEALEDVRVVRSWASEELSERWLAIREAWTQTTFYVFHPESWR